MKPKILVSANALSQAQKELSKAFLTIFNFSEQASFRSQLVSTISPDLLSWPTHFNDEWGNEFMRLARKIAAENLKDFETRATDASELILQTINSRKQSVRAIIDFAKINAVGIIAAITHLQDEDRLLSFPGSFVETLVAESPLPVLVVNSKSDPIKKFESILVPTDFSKACRHDFEYIIQLAKILKAKITLLHVLTTPEGMSIVENAGLIGGWPRVENFIQSVESEARKSSSEMLALAKNENVEIEFSLIRNRERLSKVILDQALSSRASMIAMTNQTGPIVSLILGSMTRQLMRNSQLPILVFPPKTH